MAIQHFRAGGFFTDTPADIIELWGAVGTDNNVSHLRRPHLTAGYQVTAGKTLHLVKLVIRGTGAGAGVQYLKMGYADNDVGLDTATARTAPVMAFGLDDTADNGLPFLFLAASSGVAIDPQSADSAFVWKLAIAAKFPFLRMAGTNVPQMIFAWCIEL